MVYPLTRLTLFPFLRSYISSVEGKENLPTKAPFIIAANHISQSDPLFIIASIFPYYGKKIHFIANRGNYSKWFEQKIARDWAGCIIINPKNPDSKCLGVAHDFLKRGDIIGLFPEGERVFNKPILGRGRTGVARLALKSKMPVVPLGIITKGEPHRLVQGELGSSWHDLIYHYLFKKAPCHIKIGRPLLFSNYYGSPINYHLLRLITDEIMGKIAGLSGKNYIF
jgi:1-acyl-sn-glycerol-3-phosphate acyltransferase